MAEKTNKQILVSSYPEGMPKESDFQLVEKPVRQPGDGELLIRTLYLSVDPYMRGRLSGRKSYIDPVAVGDVMEGETVGVVEISKNEKFQEGDTVAGGLGWQQFATSDGRGVRKVTNEDLPVSTALHILGMTGMTAYFGLLDICEPKSGETVVVSGAAGAVGSVAGQIAKIKGCRVIGTVGSDEKLAYITDELGFDGGFNYKATDDYRSQFKKLCPAGIDSYFDNVGGPLSDAVFGRINVGARIAVCGQISLYNLEKLEQGPRLFGQLIVMRAKVQGFLVTDFSSRYRQALESLTEWVRSGQIKYRENVISGIENAPRAFIGLFHGENIGKQLVKVS